MKIKETIPFRGFDERGDVRIYKNGILPHWRQAGCTYFVTFRQADSLPIAVQRELRHERQLWLVNQGIDPDAGNWKTIFSRLPKEKQREYERRVGAKLNALLDAGFGSCVLGNGTIANIVADALDYFHGDRVATGDIVVMPNHVHVLLTPLDGFELEEILQSVKSYSATQINRRLQTTGNLWQRDSYDHIVRDFDQLLAFQRYICANPITANLKSGQFLHLPSTYRPDE